MRVCVSSGLFHWEHDGRKLFTGEPNRGFGFWQRRAAAGGPGAQPWTHPAEKAKQNKVAKKVPDTVVKLSAEDSNKLKQAKVSRRCSPSTMSPRCSPSTSDSRARRLLARSRRMPLAARSKCPLPRPSRCFKKGELQRPRRTRPRRPRVEHRRLLAAARWSMCVPLPGSAP